MDLIDKANRSKDEVTETLEVASLQDRHSFKRLLVVSVTFSILTLSAVLGLSYVLLIERNTLRAMAVLPPTLESQGSIVDKILALNNQGSHCLLESSVEAIQRRIKNGDRVTLQLKGYTDHFVAVAMDQNNDKCFFNAQGRRVCVSSSPNCEEFPVEPRSRNLLSPDEEYDAQCTAYIASVEQSAPGQWDYAVSFVAECVASCQSLGCPCRCLGLDLQQNDSSPTNSPTKAPKPCKRRNGKPCPQLNP